MALCWKTFIAAPDFILSRLSSSSSLRSRNIILSSRRLLKHCSISLYSSSSIDNSWGRTSSLTSCKTLMKHTFISGFKKHAFYMIKTSLAEMIRETNTLSSIGTSLDTRISSTPAWTAPVQDDTHSSGAGPGLTQCRVNNIFSSVETIRLNVNFKLTKHFV